MRRLLVLALLGLTGCSGWGAAHTARMRGAYDLDCEVDRVVAFRVVGGTYVAEGCDHWTEYSCDRRGATCVRTGAIYRVARQ
jgi:hypothetical protein